MTAADPYGSPNPHRLYRVPERGVIRGVCAGLAEYLDLAVWQVRALAVLALFVFPPHAVLAYLVLAFVLRRRPPQLYRSPEEERFWAAVSQRPNTTVAGLRHRFRTLEDRLIAVERQVTSDEFTLGQAFRDLERGSPSGGPAGSPSGGPAGRPAGRPTVGRPGGPAAGPWSGAAG